MSPSSPPVQSAFPRTATFYQPTTTPTLETLILACLSPLLIAKFLLSLAYLFIQRLVVTVVNSPVPKPCPGLWDGKGDKAREGREKTKVAAGTCAGPGIRPFGGTTFTITISVGACRLAVVTVTVAALTALAVPFLPSTPSFFTLFNRFGGSGTISSSGTGDGTGFGVDIKMGGVSG